MTDVMHKTRQLYKLFTGELLDNLRTPEHEKLKFSDVVT